MHSYTQMALAQQEYMVRLRRYFHEHPELSKQEDGTVDTICKELSDMDIPFVNVKNGGVFAFLGDEKRGRTVLLRADIDALPGQESPLNGGGKPKVCVSKVDGVSHTCGHDCHAAMLLGAAKALKAMENELEGRVVLMFERGEEGGGNIAYLLKWAFEHGLQLDTSFGMHVFPTAPTGKIEIAQGAAMAGAIPFRIKLIGKAAHGSAPSEGVNPIDCFVAIYNTMQSLRMRFANPYDGMVFSVGKVQAGTVGNIIPGELEFAGSFRVLNDADALRVWEELVRTVDLTAELYHCRAEYAIRRPTLTLKNDPACTSFTQTVLSEALGAENVLSCNANMASESHCLTASIWPGTYVFVGIHNAEKGMTARNHNECFEPDEDALSVGAACHIAYAAEFLKNGPDTSDRIYRGTLRDFFTRYNPPSMFVFEEEDN